ncbi:putative ABC exporter domain-containing protein [Rhodopirellula sp. MGV]|uniref:putative ABC exporter domain-containing protein n=1 Tax=Rhodopirellula sp. MGV TaxID=2023130 RepID=UPI000B974B2A|nr:putative ABC exporter domain-containing protein [Rhodopirellula sp. MGV]OYP28931.1 hypothetical protein CGZ80_25535 [Rhodopirellula sp. MGV]PNY36952.1 hypothetical protein C2E31_10070 [Rhodopirellula baltica]
MIHPALLRLIGALAFAALRKFGQICRKPTGLIFVVFILGCFGFGVAPSILIAFHPDQSEMASSVRRLQPVLPIMLSLVFFGLILTDSGRGMLELRPPELQFILAGPFTSTQILSYRLITVALALLPLFCVGSVVLRPHVARWDACLVGVVLTFATMIMLAFHYTLIKPRLTSGMIACFRWGIITSTFVLMLESVFVFRQHLSNFEFDQFVQAIAATWSGRILGAPFYPFVQTAIASDTLKLLQYASISCGILGLTTCSCYLFSSGFAELAVEGVARRQQRLESLRRGSSGMAKSGRERKARFSLPALPYMSGLGPVAWLSLTSAWRRTGKLLIGLTIASLMASLGLSVYVTVFPEVIPNVVRLFVSWGAFGVAAYVGVLVAMGTSGGLTAPPRTLTWYYLLPISPYAIAIGATAGSTATLFAVQCVLQIPAIALTTQPWFDAVSILLLGLVFALILSSVISFVSVTTGIRPMPQGTPDVFQGARVLVFMMLVGLALVPPLLFAFGTAATTAALFGVRQAAFAIGGAVGAAIWLPAIWWYSGLQFRQRELQIAE